MRTLTDSTLRTEIKDTIRYIIEDFEKEPTTTRDTLIERLDEDADSLFGSLVRYGRIDQYNVEDLIATAQPCATILQVAHERDCVETDTGLWEGLTFGVLASIAFFSLRNLLNEQLTEQGYDINADEPFAKPDDDSQDETQDDDDDDDSQGTSAEGHTFESDPQTPNGLYCRVCGCGRGFHQTQDDDHNDGWLSSAPGWLASAQTLAKQADETATFRGHSMSAWDWKHSAGRTVGFATCERCKALAHIDTNPEPNGIDISGPAVAMNCQDDDTNEDPS